MNREQLKTLGKMARAKATPAQVATALGITEQRARIALQLRASLGETLGDFSDRSSASQVLFGS